MRIFWDERGYQVTEAELSRQYQILIEYGEIDSDEVGFLDYVRECTGKHGTLTEIKNKKETEK